MFLLTKRPQRRGAKRNGCFRRLLSGPSALEILREDRDLRTSLSETRYSCGTDTGVALDVEGQSDQ